MSIESEAKTGEQQVTDAEPDWSAAPSAGEPACPPFTGWVDTWDFRDDLHPRRITNLSRKDVIVLHTLASRRAEAERLAIEHLGKHFMARNEDPYGVNLQDQVRRASRRRFDGEAISDLAAKIEGGDHEQALKAAHEIAARFIVQERANEVYGICQELLREMGTR